MTGLVRKATLLTVCGMISACAALAAVPDASKSSIGNIITWGGTAGGVVDVKVQKTVTIRDGGNNPVQNSTVTLDFTTCTSSDFRLCSTQPFGGLTINCGAHTVSAITNPSGVATFRIVGGATNGGGNPAGVGTTDCCVVRADGVLMGNLSTATYDENNSGGVTGQDTSAYTSDRFGGYRQRSDFNASNDETGQDTALFSQVRFGGGSTASCSGGSCVAPF